MTTAKPGRVVVYRYGVPARWSPPADVDQQLYLAHRLREDLVSLEHARADALAALWSSHPEIDETEKALTDVEQRAAETAKRAAAQRSEARKRGATPAAAELTELRKQVRALKVRRRELISTARADAKPRVDAIAAEHKAAVKATYATFCQTENPADRLFYGTYYDVVAAHDTAVKRVAATRRDGRPAALRHHRFDGSGGMSAFLLRQAEHPPRSPATIADAEHGKWRNQFQLTPWADPDDWAELSRAEQRRWGRGVARFGFGKGRTVEVPVQVHRMLPADADILAAKLVVTRRAGKRVCSVHVTARIGAPDPVTAGPTIAVHLGWRRDTTTAGTQVTRVATWRADADVTVPVGLRARIDGAPPVLTQDTASTGTIVLPPELPDRAARHDALRAERDLALDVLRERLARWLDVHGPVADGDREVGAADVRRWKATGRFARLAMAWRADPPPGDDGIVAELETWRAADRRQWETEAHGRARLVDARDDAYRRACAWLADTAGRVVVDDSSIAEIARRGDPTDEPDTPTAEVERAGAHARTVAAPGRLRELLVTAAGARGVPVVTVAHGGLSRVHAGCGHQNPADGRFAAARVVACDGCGRRYDQDASATVQMLARAG